MADSRPLLSRNLHDAMIGVSGGLRQGTVERIIKVDARGALT